MENLKEVVEIFNLITKISGKNDKIKIVKWNKDNELFIECLKFLLDSDIVTGLSKKKINKDISLKDDRFKLDTIREVMEYLKAHNSGRDIDIAIVREFCNKQTDTNKEFCIGLFTKSLKIGMDVKGVNKAIPNLIQQHQVMLASKFEGKLKNEVSMSLKLDGIRNSAMIENNRILHKSRQGKVVEGLNQINKALEELKLDGYFIDGELIRINYDNIPSDENFRLTTTIVNSKSDNKEGLEFVVFDMTPIEDYHKGKCNMTYTERLKLMEEKIGKGNEFIRLVPKFGITKDIDEIYSKLNEVVSQQLEGLMLNDLNGKYEFGKRPKTIMKVKKFQDGDVLVTDIIEGEGRLVGTLGKIEVQFKYNDKIYTNYVGSGFNDSERKYYWEHKDELIGKVITISYFEISTNKQGEYGFRFPTWKGGKEYIRFDKEGIDDTNVE